MRDDPSTDPELRARTRALTGVVLASALVYPLLVCAVQLAFAQFVTDDVPDAVLYGSLTVGLCVGVVAVVRWSVGRRFASPWLLAGLVPPLLFELWLAWPLLTG